ncbi:Pectinesterase inhibitor domain [Sesbania bispinosa]|nr:Pectinesterase inhibitor domain [Sesbania bispinosa]
MANLKQLPLMCRILVLLTISMSIGHCRVLQPNDAKLIEETCKKTPYPTFCIQFIQADPRSSSADVKGLALIMVDVIKTKAKASLLIINQLLQEGGEKKALSSCFEKYRVILQGDVPQATQALQNGNPKFAESGAIDSGVEAISCEKSFSGKSPLTDVNNIMHIAANVTVAIVRLLL